MLRRSLLGALSLTFTLPLALLLTACAGLKPAALNPQGEPVFLAQADKNPVIYDSSADTEQDRPILVRALSLVHLAPQLAKSAPASTREQLLALAGEAEPYRLGAGDVLSITGLGENAQGQAKEQVQTARSVTIDAQGVVDLGDWGAYRLQGLTPAQAQRVLHTELQDTPHSGSIQLSVSQYHSQFVRLQGQIYAPGLYPITASPMSLAEAITRAGSLLADADLERIILSRNGGSVTLNLRALYAQGLSPEAIMLRNGDSLDFLPKQ